jgi:hypothetical protein
LLDVLLETFGRPGVFREAEPPAAPLALFAPDE